MTFTRIFPDSVELLIARALYSFIPIVFTANLLGWALQLNRLASNIRDVEEDLERLQEKGSADMEQVLRIVSEYNCQVVASFPIHNRLFKLWHNEIEDLWRQR